MVGAKIPPTPPLPVVAVIATGFNTRTSTKNIRKMNRLSWCAKKIAALKNGRNVSGKKFIDDIITFAIQWREKKDKDTQGHATGQHTNPDFSDGSKNRFNINRNACKI